MLSYGLKFMLYPDYTGMAFHWLQTPYRNVRRFYKIIGYENKRAAKF